jgi:hypothetical protein
MEKPIVIIQTGHVRTGERGNLTIPQKYHTYPNVLIINYDELLETENQSLQDIVTNLYNKLSSFLPITLNQETVLQRIVDMNTFYETIKDEKFSYIDDFYELHGSHRCRDKKYIK